MLYARLAHDSIVYHPLAYYRAIFALFLSVKRFKPASRLFY
jgi:hypothetical protein